MLVHNIMYLLYIFIFLQSLLLDTLQLALNYWKNKITSDNSWPTSISWKTDGLSFPVHLVLDLIGLCRQLLNSSKQTVNCVKDFHVHCFL